MTKSGYELLKDPFLNKGTAFTQEERKAYQLEGLLPPAVETIELQAERVYAEMKKKSSLIEERRFLMDVFNHNRTLFYYVFREHLVELMPIVYDPVIAESIEKYSEQFVDTQNACYLSIDRPDEIEASLRSAAEGREIRLIVATDAEGILGIGDWGTNGVDIAVGKLMVYSSGCVGLRHKSRVASAGQVLLGKPSSENLRRAVQCVCGAFCSGGREAIPAALFAL